MLFLACKEQSSESGAQRPKLNLKLHFGFSEELSKRRLASNITHIPVVTTRDNRQGGAFSSRDKNPRGGAEQR